MAETGHPDHLRRSFVRELNAPVEFDALPQDRHLTFPPDGFVLDVARRITCRTGGKRLDHDPVQHGADSGAPAVGIPRFTRRGPAPTGECRSSPWPTRRAGRIPAARR